MAYTIFELRANLKKLWSVEPGNGQTLTFNSDLAKKIIKHIRWMGNKLKARHGEVVEQAIALLHPPEDTFASQSFEEFDENYEDFMKQAEDFEMALHETGQAFKDTSDNWNLMLLLNEHHQNMNYLDALRRPLMDKRYEQHLLSSHRPSEGQPGSSSRQDILVNEHTSVSSCHEMIDDQVALLLNTRERLSEQRNVFKSVQARMNTMLGDFPRVNSLVQRILARKRRDHYIIVLLIFACVIVSLFYVLY